MATRSKSWFAVYSLILFLFPLGMAILILVQRAADKYHAKVAQIDRDKRTTWLLYAIYVSGLICGLVGFSLHFGSSVLWCEKFGLLPCFALLGLSKAFLYLFFLRRARFAQGIIANKCIKLFFNPIAPSYLFIYWMIYCILTTIVFTGNYSHNATISNCSLLGEWAQGFSIFAGFVELFNSTISVLIFTYPLIRTMYQVKLLGDSAQFNSKADYATKLQFISVMKWNVILTSIASLSSVTNLFMMLVAGHYIWLFCLGDPLINGLCVLLMIAPNREYIAHICGCSVSSPSAQIEYDIKDTATTSTTTGTTDNTKESVPDSTVDVVIH